MAHFALTTDNVDAEGTVALFLKHVFTFHGLPDDVVSDWGTTFTAKFMQEVLKALKIQQKLSSAYHPQIDGQTECTNAILEQYLQSYIYYQQSDWSTLLPWAKFAYNNTSQSSTQVSPFFANMGYHPRFSVTVPRASKTNQSTTDQIQQLEDLHTDLKFNIQMALERHALYYDTKTMVQPDFQVGDKVWLSSKNIHTNWPAKKLDYKKQGRFKILEKVNNCSYHLELPWNYKIHPVFHVSLLEHYHPDLIPGQAPRHPPPVEIWGEQEYAVKQIEDSRWFRGGK